MDELRDAGQRTRPVFEQIVRISRTHKRVVERQIAELGIHGGQHRMLMMLSWMGQSPAQNELARRMDISPASAANMLKRLESGGYIERRARSSDGRCNEVSITEKGQRVVEQSVHIFEGVDRRMFEDIDPQERARLHASLEKVLGNLRKIEEEIGCGAEEDSQSEEGNETSH